jgi:hypothetical protein
VATITFKPSPTNELLGQIQMALCYGKFYVSGVSFLDWPKVDGRDITFQLQGKPTEAQLAEVAKICGVPPDNVQTTCERVCLCEDCEYFEDQVAVRVAGGAPQ